MAMSPSVLIFSTILALTVICLARPLENKIKRPENEVGNAMRLLRGLQEIKPLELGPISQRSVDLFSRKTTIRAGCSSSERQDVRDCSEECQTRCGPQCCVGKRGTIIVLCSTDCCANFDTETDELVTPTYKCTPAGSSNTSSGTSSGTGSSGSSTDGKPSTTAGGGNRKSSESSPGSAGDTAKPKETSSPKPRNCFGASAHVELESGILKRMDELAVGDRIKVGNNLYSDIFMFTHKSPAVRNNFLVIGTVSGQAITLTPGHFIYLNNALVDSATAKVGDTIYLGSGAVSVVSSVSQTVEAGLYNPQTVHGDIVVNGIIASTYTTALPPGTAHALLLPLRALYSVFSLRVNIFENGAIGSLVGNLLAGSFSEYGVLKMFGAE
jgi:desert hedgehog